MNMINEIINKYEQFSDALISEINYKSSIQSRNIEVIIKCMNSHKDYKWETIKLIFIDVLFFKFTENENTSSTLINSALIKEEKNMIIVDFFALIFGNNDLKENANSDFIVKCKTLKYKLLS
jgi:hypothetical protein